MKTLDSRELSVDDILAEGNIRNFVGLPLREGRDLARRKSVVRLSHPHHI